MSYIINLEIIQEDEQERNLRAPFPNPAGGTSNKKHPSRTKKFPTFLSVLMSKMKFAFEFSTFLTYTITSWYVQFG